MKVAAILLTGGASSRLGTDKARLTTAGGRTLADRTAELLRAVADPVVEAGPGVSGLPNVVEARRAGPLGAVVVAAGHLALAGPPCATLVVATDLPSLSVSALELLARFPGGRSVIPRVAGAPQVLCARYSPEFLATAADAFSRGERSLRRLVERSEVTLLDEDRWDGHGGAGVFDDIDTRQDHDRMVAAGVLRA